MSTTETFRLRSSKLGNEVCAVNDGSLEAFMVVGDHDEAVRYVNLLNEINVNCVKI